MYGASLPKPWMTPTGYRRKLSRLFRRLPIVCLFVPSSIHASLNTLLAHAGKSASLSQVALSAMNIDVDTSRLLDIVSPFTTRTLKDRKNTNKENLSKAVSPTPIRKSDIKSDFVIVESSEVSKKVRVNTPDQSSSLSPAPSSSKSKHARSQSQPRLLVKSGLLSRFFNFCGADVVP